MNKFTYLLLFLFCMMGVMNAQELEISGFTKAAENRTLPAELTTGYYLIKEVNPNASGKPGGYLKSASEAANAVITPQVKTPPTMAAMLWNCGMLKWDKITKLSPFLQPIKKLPGRLLTKAKRTS